MLHFRTPEDSLALAQGERITSGEVHVWPVSLIGSEDSRERLATLLTDEEKARAQRYYFERDRKAFVFSRGQMRHLLALYCAVDGAALRFVAGASGKPALAPDQPFANVISFNFTHSAGRALLAVSDGRELGVDLECHDRKTDVLALAERYFFGSESDAILGTPEAHRVAAFFRFWTAKEAVIKAQGTGLGAPLNRFCVHPSQASDAVRVDTFDTAHIDEGWFLRTLTCEPGWSAAVVAKSADWQVKLRPSPAGPRN